MPITLADGNSFAVASYQHADSVHIDTSNALPNSIAHIPVPVATSRTLCTPPGISLSGARYRAPSRVNKNR